MSITTSLICFEHYGQMKNIFLILFENAADFTFVGYKICIYSLRDGMYAADNTS